MNTESTPDGRADKPRYRKPQGADDARREHVRSANKQRDHRGSGSSGNVVAHRRSFPPRGKRRFGHGKQSADASPREDAAAESQPTRAYVPVGEPTELTGLLEITSKGFGFMRVPENNWAPSTEAVYVPADIIAEHHLRPFSKVCGMAQKYERGHQLISVKTVNGMPPEQAAECPHFDDLKAVNPTERIAFETRPDRYTTRTLDLVAPVARGQRGLIVAPPRTGKTTLLMHIAEAVLEKYKGELELLVLLVDERPEEVTEFRRALPGAEIFASSNDSGIREHCRMAEMCITYAKRLMESGKHVLVLMDSITRLARAYNNAEKGSGRTMSGGIDARALETPRMLFAAARNTRQAGSITILATALIETNSRMDELIFQEFKGTGNMELVLNRRIAELYIYPAVDIMKSGTRREELILPAWMLEKMSLIRRGLAGHKPPEAMERLLFFMRRCSTNAQMLMNLKTR